jgi:hypothetical protein
MRGGLALIIGFSIGPLTVIHPAAAQQQKQESSKQKKAPAKTTQSSLTGCVDEHDGQYVLIHDQNRSTIANLEADGFPVEGFAKHLGHKVTVRGTVSPGGTERPVFKVRAVETVSESCGPNQH